MTSRKISLLVTFIASLQVGCASLPKPVDSGYSHTKIKFPDINIIKTINKGDLVYLNYDYESKFAFTTESEVNTSIVFDRVFVPKGASLTPSTLEGKEVLCYNDRRPICFYSYTSKDYLNVVSMAPGAVWFKKDLVPPIKYTTSETPRKKSNPTKKELIFEGVDQNIVSFIYKEYNEYLLQPTLMQPVLVEISSVPTLMNVKDLKIEVTQFTDKSLTYRVID